MLSLVSPNPGVTFKKIIDFSRINQSNRDVSGGSVESWARNASESIDLDPGLGGGGLETSLKDRGEEKRRGSLSPH